MLTLREAFTKYLDINTVPRRSFFDHLRHFATDDLEREKLNDFCTLEGQVLFPFSPLFPCCDGSLMVSFDTKEDLYDYCQRVRRTIREVVSEFRSARIPKEYIFDVFPPLRPRQFSIASSAKVLSSYPLLNLLFTCPYSGSPSSSSSVCRHRSIPYKASHFATRGLHNVFVVSCRRYALPLGISQI